MAKTPELVTTLRFRATAGDKRRLNRLAKHHDTGFSEVLRALIKEAHALLPQKLPKAPKDA
jgi:hypothetical protein